ncbi:MAG: 2Fe-2S iron-sulfur cluster binding domain-containing protein [Chlorobi bacterium]|nr:2Fe-2S iron-sulfur cluster binding domain-containing protein [Chlorobiota bacterium]
MKNTIELTINGEKTEAMQGEYIVDAARRQGIYIPTLCNLPGIKPAGSCRICTVFVNDRLMTSCTTPVGRGMEIVTESKELDDFRNSVVELLLVEGNHLCPSCEKGGNCELQAMGYRLKVMAPRFPYQFPDREIDANNPKLIKDHNRCILCKRCIRTIFDEEGHHIFAFRYRGHDLQIIIDPTYGKNMTDEQAQKAMDNCPVGALLYRGIGFSTPIGKRKYDKKPIGSEIENKRRKEVLS